MMNEEKRILLDSENRIDCCPDLRQPKEKQHVLNCIQNCTYTCLI